MMDLIKKHLFFVVLIAAVVVLCGAALAYRTIKIGDTETTLKGKLKVFSDIRGLGQECPNETMLTSQQDFVKNARQRWSDLVTEANKTNLRDHKPLEVNVGGGKIIEVFKLDPVKYDVVVLHFSDAYKRKMEALLERLGAVEPPTPEQIELEAKRVYNAMELAIRPKSSTDEEAVYLPAGVQPPYKPVVLGKPGETPGSEDLGMPPVLPPTVVTPTTPGPDEETKTVDPREAEMKAIENLKAEKALTGRFYASEKSLTFHPLESRPLGAEMWKAWINLLLHERVVDSILATNDAAAKPSGKPWVIENAAVKRLVKVAMGRPGLRQGQTRLYYREGEHTFEQRKTPTSFNLETHEAIESYEAPEPAPTLTQRVCNPDYDVVVFDVTVVMRSSEINRFIHALEAGDFLTVLKWRLTEPGTPVIDTKGLPAPPPDMQTPIGPPTVTLSGDEERYYYGSEPVTQVTLTVEALFFSEWRTKWMPWQMLRDLPNSALRPEDRKLLEEKLSIR